MSFSLLFLTVSYRFQLNFVRRGENGYTTTVVSEANGTSVSEETYTEEGLSTVTNNKKTGKVFKECWDRLLVEDGWYKCVGHENMEGYYKATSKALNFDLTKGIESLTCR